MATSDPEMIFKNTFSLKGVIQHYEKLKISEAVEFDEALEHVEVLCKRGLSGCAPAQLSKFRDILVGDSKIETALSELKGGVGVKPPKLVVTADSPVWPLRAVLTYRSDGWFIPIS